MIAEPSASSMGPMPFRQLLDEAWRLARRHWKALFLPVALPLAVFQIGLMLVQMTSMKGAFSKLNTDPTAVFAMFGSLVPILLLQMVVATIAYGALSVAAIDVTAGRPASLGQGLRFAALPAVFLTLWLGGVGFGVGLLFCILPGLYLISVLAFLMPVMRLEGRRFFDAYSRCWELAHFNPRGDFLSLPAVKAFVLLAVGYAFAAAISLVVQLPFMIAQQFMIFRQAASGADPASLMFEGPAMWLQMPGALVGSLAQSAAALYLSCGLGLLYRDLLRRSEGGDLEAAIHQLAPPEVPS